MIKKIALVFIFLCGINNSFADETKKNKAHFDIHSESFKAAQPWAPVKSAIATGVSVGSPVACLLNFFSFDNNVTITASLITGILAGSVMGAKQARYQDVYNKAGGLSIHGVAAANNVSGTQAWIDYNGKEKLLEKDALGRVPLMYASGNGATDAARIIIAAMPKEEMLVVSRTASHTTVTETYRLIDTIDKRDDHGRSAIHYAAGSENLETMRLLYQKGASIHAKDKGGITLRKLAKNNHAVQQFLAEIEQSQ